jgi:hypothetical protein
MEADARGLGAVGGREAGLQVGRRPRTEQQEPDQRERE